MSSIVSNIIKVGKAVKNGDSWENVLTGLGIKGRDKRKSTRASYSFISEVELENIHDSDDIAKRVVNEIPNRGTNKWVSHKVSMDEGGSEMAEKISDFEEDICLKEKVAKAWAWARLYGGASIFISVDDGLDLSEPLNFNRIVRVNALHVFNKFELHRGELDEDLDSKNFGLPLYYTPEGTSERIHHTRFIKFQGSPLSKNKFENNDYWNDSVLTAIHDILADYGAAYGGVANALQDFSLTVMKLRNLPEIISSGEGELVTERLRIMNLAKSIMGAAIIDANEENIESLDRQFTNVDKVLDKLDQRLVAATGMPHTVILGEGSTGSLSGAGESESDNMNTLVASEQSKNLVPGLKCFYKIMFASKQGPTSGEFLKSHHFEPNPLKEETKKEKAETRKLVAETDNIYYQMAAVSGEEVRESRFGGDEYSMEMKIDRNSDLEFEETAKIDPKKTKEEFEE